MKIRFYSVFLVVAVIARCRCRAPLILIALIYIRLLKVRTRLTVWHFVLQAHREGGQTSLEQVMDGMSPLARGRRPVALVILDGVVDTRPHARRMSYKPGDGADNVVQLTRQKPSAWSIEIEAAPVRRCQVETCRLGRTADPTLDTN